MSQPRDFYAPLEGLGPGMAGAEDCENLSTRLKTKKMIAGKYLARHFLSIQQFLGQGELDDAY